ncbi:TonB-dependent receptor family protein [Microbulbifer hydrolyticus]|uniref:Fe(3+) dicitrate transport protein n=1 Tax=Microbulbifer hydrolyticus TaxID=48074 RepID=A0A6P1TD12_9GAMM|nr:TonB-dependent receptor [Microbulbifer hydrolyticus]MBB5211767.1 Fe(3+) dicitrate transport protein [Microbulbifer hydrolyticus]QHQ40638.1 TonB-dependent receptor [Microbulbifer hydrolyticus]
MRRFSLTPISLALAASLATPVTTAAEQPEVLETVSVLGAMVQLKKLPGSAHLVTNEELEKFEFVDINRMMRSVPGVYLREEDGYGLRPNIGIRGADGGRSGKVSLMEDGVLIAPAPYSAPEAYYFPTAGRMNSIEVLKGPATLKYGPFTVGGAVNLLSTPIPEASAGSIQLEAGQYGENRLHTYYGSSTETSGWLLETHQQQADGFRDIDRAGSADIAKQDYLLKGRLKSAEGAAFAQQLDVKVQYSEEESGMSYLGLSDADFAADPNRRYGISALDEMQNRHSTVQLNHSIALGDGFSLDTQAYYNKFKRDWFKVGLGGLISDANDGDTFAQAVLQGDEDYDFGIKHNDRNYVSRGVQVSANLLLEAVGIEHDLQVGVRRHWDEVDRFQPVENFSQVSGELIYRNTSDPSSSNNRVEDADATSLFVYDQVQLTKKLALTASLRYEDVQTAQQRYNNVDRSEAGSSKSNKVDEWLPGLGLTYAISDQLTILAGVHRGFAPAGAGASKGEAGDLSTNYEWGVRFDNSDLNAALVAFYSDYESAVQNCSVAIPCANGDDSGTYALGESEIQGVEVSLGSEWVLANGWAFPLSASYTYTDAEISKNGDEYIDSNGAEGLARGDNFAYLPENVFAVTTGIDSGAEWRVNLTAAYQDEMCVDTSCNRGGTDQFDRTESVWVVDAAAHYDFSNELAAYLKVDNLLDDQAIINRAPDGARANRPRTASVGMTYRF